MEVERCRHLDFAIIFAVMGVLIVSGHRPASQHGDEIKASSAQLRGEEEPNEGKYVSLVETSSIVEGDCSEQEKPRCCPKGGAAAEDKLSEVEGCSCTCKKDKMKALWKDIDGKLKSYEDQGFPVKKVVAPATPNYKGIESHILKKFTNYANAGKGGKLKDVPEIPDIDEMKDEAKNKKNEIPAGTEFEKWMKKFYDKSVPGVDRGKENVTLAKDAPSIESDAAKEELAKDDGTLIKFIDNPSEPAKKSWKLGSPASKLKGDWYKAINDVAADAFKLRMMAEEALFALRDFHLQAVETSNEKVKKAEEKMKKKKVQYEKEQAEHRIVPVGPTRDASEEDH